MPTRVTSASAADDGDLDVRALGQALWRRKRWVIGPTILMAAASIAFVTLVTPRYKSEARILFDGRENVFLRPEVDKTNPDRGAADVEALTSQVQLILSRQLAADIIKRERLAELPEFDPATSPVRMLLSMVGLGRDSSGLSPEERTMEVYYERMSAFPIDKSRVIGIEFQSQDAALAARVANAIAQGYLSLEQGVKQDQTRAAGQWLLGEIDGLRRKVADAEAKVEQYRSKNNLFIGTNNATLSNQQLGELATQVGTARAQKSDSETRARVIRDMLKKGEPIEASDVLNSELVRRLSEQRATLRGQLAEQSSTLLDGHPRIKELKAQIGDLDVSVRHEAERLVRSFESDAKIAGARVDALGANLDTLKRQTGATNEQDVELRALDREARAQRDLLESYLAKYREATARDSIGVAPTDARIISRAAVATTPYFPKKTPIVLVVTLATLLMSVGFITTGELLSSGGPQAAPARLRASARDVTRDVAASDSEVAVLTLDALARRLRLSGEKARRIAVFDLGFNSDVSTPALTLARVLGRQGRVVVVDLAAGASHLRLVSAGPGAPTLADAIRGDATFGDMITQDPLSRVHLVLGGDVAPVLAAPRFAMAIEALARTYDHVILDAGIVDAVEVTHLADVAGYAVLVASAAKPETVRAAEAKLSKAGFTDRDVLIGVESSANAA